MDKKYLIVNTGSASKKYALYAGGKEVCKAHFEKEDGKLVVTFTAGLQRNKKNITQAEYGASIRYLLELLQAKKIISAKSDIEMIGLRVVAPGDYFLSSCVVDKTYFNKLKASEQEAPLHIHPIIAEIRQLKKILPGVQVVGVSDSAFHANMPFQSKLYSLPEKVVRRFGMYRYGYHGISMQSILPKVKSLLGELPSKMIICHLGSGSSIAAVENGVSIDTSMGFTPLEGVPMGTRIGNIDAGAVIYLAQKLGLSLRQLETYFNSKCGLLGLSGKTADVRELIKLEKAGDRKAKIALETFVYHIKKYIGAYSAALNGLELLVFTATIGERSFIMRSRICSELEGLGIALDEKKNDKLVGSDGFIHEKRAPVKIAVIHTDEMGEIARQMLKCKI
ncbi:MAG: acetate/propionate family kinase [Candidatus Harrisonbacteria bacterium]|nr:acetate/propionate family kinase [Candidatus Harrisonbacteria bacterium]